MDGSIDCSRSQWCALALAKNPEVRKTLTNLLTKKD